MTRAGAIAFLLSAAVCGCRTAEDVASTSASVVTAPVHYVSKKFGGDQTSTETTETTAYENQPVETAPPPQPAPTRSPRTVTSTMTTSSPQPNETHPSTSATSHPGTTPQSSSTNSAAH